MKWTRRSNCARIGAADAPMASRRTARETPVPSAAISYLPRCRDRARRARIARYSSGGAEATAKHMNSCNSCTKKIPFERITGRSIDWTVCPLVCEVWIKRKEEEKKMNTPRNTPQQRRYKTLLEGSRAYRHVFKFLKFRYKHTQGRRRLIWKGRYR